MLKLPKLQYDIINKIAIIIIGLFFNPILSNAQSQSYCTLPTATPNNNSFGQPIEAKKAFAHFIKFYHLNYHQKGFLKTYLYQFDPQYDSYKENEFEFQRKIEDADLEIKSLIESLNENDFYTASIDG